MDYPDWYRTLMEPRLANITARPGSIAVAATRFSMEVEDDAAAMLTARVPLSTACHGDETPYETALI